MVLQKTKTEFGIPFHILVSGLAGGCFDASVLVFEISTAVLNFSTSTIMLYSTAVPGMAVLVLVQATRVQLYSLVLNI